ncbi:AraC family transcriptional regulator [Polyangium aurulentum]|uniref:AraC family transcriptional regulator n=1 Tax=Polyangium aurulentum TaxID=2567896 RepID=UPI00146B90EA|nr:AraC family transcriptional regulator [Polyangium aurulentum]UQA59909.1 AraC family transcriptional regulator [Polyangium aurulentum]
MSWDILTQLFESMSFDKADAILSELHSPWGVALPGGHDLTGLHVVLEGSLELHVPPLAPVRMHAGDIAFLPVDRPHDVRDRATTELVPVNALPCAEVVGRNVRRLRHGGHGERTRTLSVGLPLDISWRTPFLCALPPLLLVPGDGQRPDPALAPLVHRLVEEVELRRPGYLAALGRLIELLIIEMLRMKADEGERDAGLVNTPEGPRISAALAAMHGGVDRDWSVSELAGIAGMSRSLFATRFAAVVGVAPHQYLIRIRLQYAAQLLRSRELTVLEVAERVGYRSESSFSRIFTREMGIPPATYRKQQWEGARAGRRDDGMHAPPESGPAVRHSQPATRPALSGHRVNQR